MNKNTKSLLIILGVAFGMVGVAYASVPLYRMFCAMTGWDGTPKIYSEPATAEDKRDRTILVQFNGDVDANLDWAFRPEQKRVTAQVGVPQLVNFEGKNLSGETLTGTAVYNVSPEKAARYFNKTQCFCFARQALNPGQRSDFPVQFYIDPSFVEDSEMEDVKIITLSYTFYKADSKALDEALAGGYTASE